MIHNDIIRKHGNKGGGGNYIYDEFTGLYLDSLDGKEPSEISTGEKWISPYDAGYFTGDGYYTAPDGVSGPSSYTHHLIKRPSSLLYEYEVEAEYYMGDNSSVPYFSTYLEANAESTNRCYYREYTVNGRFYVNAIYEQYSSSMALNQTAKMRHVCVPGNVDVYKSLNGGAEILVGSYTPVRETEGQPYSGFFLYHNVVPSRGNRIKSFKVYPIGQPPV